MHPVVLVALVWVAPFTSALMFYGVYRRPSGWLAGISREHEGWVVRWFPLFLAMLTGAMVVGLPGWAGWPPVLTLVTYCAGRGGGELGRWLRERRTAR